MVMGGHLQCIKLVKLCASMTCLQCKHRGFHAEGLPLAVGHLAKLQEFPLYQLPEEAPEAWTQDGC